MKRTYLLIIGIAILFSCGSKNKPLPQNLAPTNLLVSTSIATDSSGNITLKATATGAATYLFNFGNGATQSSITGTVTYKYPATGSYSITVTATSTSGETAVVNAQANIGVKLNLVWSDEFNTPGSPDPTKWGFDLGGGGWGNNELENYTSRTNNVVISNGTLKIIAQKESYGGSSYTSARILTQKFYGFTYGKIEVRAKLPGNAGTWPAIWMLGNNISTVGWPNCGEIDIMENVGVQSYKIFGTVHFLGQPSGSGVGGTVQVPSAFTDFHRYGVIWNPSTVQFLVDDVSYFSYANSSSSPFNQNFFIILNMAMGGDFGGKIDPNFTQGQMEVDYVRVYQ